MNSGIKIIFLCPYPVGQDPSQRFRFEQYFEILRASGFQVTVAPFLSVGGWQVLYQPGNYFKELLALSRGVLPTVVAALYTPCVSLGFYSPRGRPIRSTCV